MALSRTAGGRGGGLRREPLAPAVQRRIRLGSRTRHESGALRIAPARRYRPPHPGRHFAEAGRQSGEQRSFPQRTAVRDGASRGLSPACARGQRIAARASTLQLAGGIRTDHGAGHPPSPGGRFHGRIRCVEREAVPETDQRRDREAGAAAQACRCGRQGDRTRRARGRNCWTSSASRRAPIWTRSTN